MFQEVLSPKTKHVLEKIGKTKIPGNFYLAGGTALALQIGHRKSLDLDWFSKKSFSTKNLKNELKTLGKLKVENEEEGTLNCVLDGIRLSFFEYHYRVLFPSFINYNKRIKLADLRDIACMKIDAISSRGSKKDFIDIYFLLKEFSLKELLNLFDRKYKEIKYNHLHILKSLTYFEEAEKEPMPIMLKKVSWSDEIKKEIIKKVKDYLKE